MQEQSTNQEKYGAEWVATKEAQKARERRGEGSKELSAQEREAELVRLTVNLMRYDWGTKSPFEIANTMVNIFGQSPLFGHHSAVVTGLLRMRNAFALASAAIDGAHKCG